MGLVVSIRRPMNDTLDGTALSQRSHLAAAWVEDGPLLFARIVRFTCRRAGRGRRDADHPGDRLRYPLPADGSRQDVVGWGILSSLVILLARRRDARAVRLGLSALALSLALAMVGFIEFH